MALLDQGLIASSNFALSILLARWLSPQQYGSYALAFEIFLLVSLLHQALLLEPQRVFGSTDHGDRQREYLGVLLCFNLGLAAAVIVAVGVSAWVLHTFMMRDSLPEALVGVMFAAPCILVLWLARGAYYVRMSPQYAVIGATLYCTAMFGSLGLVYKYRLLSVASAFLVMGAAALISSAVLLVRLRPVFSGYSMWGPIFRQHWTYGRWILLSSVLSWLTGAIYYPLVSSFSGMAATGALKVLLNLTLPAAQAFNALSVFVLPYASRMYQLNGVAALTHVVTRMTWLFAAGSILYWGLIIFLSKPLILLLYGARYSDLYSLVPLVAVASIPWNIAYVPAIALRAVRSSASIFAIYCASSAVAVVIGIPVTWGYGLRGALWTMTVSNAAALLVSFVLFRRRLAGRSTGR